MTYLRDGIVAREDLARNILRLEDALGTDAEKVVVEALQAKSVEDGRNLLMHAAAYGFKRGFVALIEVMLKRVSSTTVFFLQICFSISMYWHESGAIFFFNSASIVDMPAT